ncbi:MAG: APC family permease, partial [Microbacteriaceae bacterium]|nr:APC family permease [Microbacteriaceae bacterium]
LTPFALNLLGVRTAGWVQLVLTALLLIVVIMVVSLGSPAVRSDNFEPFLPHGIVGVGQAMLLLMWAFAGWEVGTHIAAEFRNPRRIIPIATVVALTLCGSAYLATQWVTVGVLGSDAGAGRVPLMSLIDVAAPGVGASVIAVIAAVMSFGVVNSYFAGAGKLGAALGRDGDLPRFLARGSEPDAVPRRSLLVMFVISSASIGIMAAQDFRVDTLLTFQVSGMVCIYVLGMIAATRIIARWSLSWWTVSPGRGGGGRHGDRREESPTARVVDLSLEVSVYISSCVSGSAPQMRPRSRLPIRSMSASLRAKSNTARFCR